VSGDAPDHGTLDATGVRFAIVASRFNQAWVRKLVDAAIATLVAHGAEVGADAVDWVPGALELPLAARWRAERGGVDAVLAFGVVLRGDTEHFRLVCDVTAHGLGRVALDSGVPVLDGVIAAHDPEQVEARTGGRLGNRGVETAKAAIAMAMLRRRIGASA
jgi:6,7-dimethyl-8-ribityllumazine synthase